MHLQTVYPPSGHYGGAGAFGFHPEAHLTIAPRLSLRQIGRNYSLNGVDTGI